MHTLPITAFMVTNLGNIGSRKHHGRVSQGTHREGKERESDGWLKESEMGTSIKVRIGLYHDYEGGENARERGEA